MSASSKIRLLYISTLWCAEGDKSQNAQIDFPPLKRKLRLHTLSARRLNVKHFPFLLFLPLFFLPARPVLISKRVISMIDEVLLGWKGGAIGQIVAQLFTFHFLEDKLLQQ